jgi:hypothetical protein
MFGFNNIRSAFLRHRTIFRTVVLLLFTGLFFQSYGQLTVSYVNATQFVQHLAGPGVTITNAVFSGVDPSQIAFFSGITNPNFGIPSGVIIASGDAMIVADTSDDYTAGTDLGGGGDADLSGACQQNTKDLGAVEFDFTPSTLSGFMLLLVLLAISGSA